MARRGRRRRKPPSKGKVAQERAFSAGWWVRLARRFRQLTLWNKLGVIGAIASIVGLVLYLLPSRRIDDGRFRESWQLLLGQTIDTLAVGIEFPNQLRRDLLQARVASVELQLVPADPLSGLDAPLTSVLLFQDVDSGTEAALRLAALQRHGNLGPTVRILGVAENPALLMTHSLIDPPRGENSDEHAIHALPTIRAARLANTSPGVAAPTDVFRKAPALRQGTAFPGGMCCLWADLEFSKLGLQPRVVRISDLSALAALRVVLYQQENPFVLSDTPGRRTLGKPTELSLLELSALRLWFVAESGQATTLDVLRLPFWEEWTGNRFEIDGVALVNELRAAYFRTVSPATSEH